MSVTFKLVYLSPPLEPLVRFLYFKMLPMSEFKSLSNESCHTLILKPAKAKAKS